MKFLNQLPPGGDGQAWNRETSRLRLVRSTTVSIAPRSKVSWAQSTIACPSRLRLVGVRAVRTDEQLEQKERPPDRSMEGRKMEKMESFVYSMSRFVFGLGIGLALTSAYVIVTSTPDLLASKTGKADVVVLDPIVVTISSERFDAIHAEAEPATKTVHLFGAGPRPV